MSGRRVIVNYPAPRDSRFAKDAFETQRGNWPPLTDEAGNPIGDIVNITVSPDGSAAIITAGLYPSIGDQPHEQHSGIEHYSTRKDAT